MCLSSDALSRCLPAGGILFERLSAQTCTEYRALVMSGGKTARALKIETWINNAMRKNCYMLIDFDSTIVFLPSVAEV